MSKKPHPCDRQPYCIFCPFTDPKKCNWFRPRVDSDDENPKARLESTNVGKEISEMEEKRAYEKEPEIMEKNGSGDRGIKIEYGKIKASDLSVIRALISNQRGEPVTEMIEREKAYVFKFENSKPYVVPKPKKEVNK